MKPLSGQANFVEKINFSNFLNFFGKVSSSYSTNNKPLDKFIDVSILSANLVLFFYLVQELFQYQKELHQSLFF